MRYGVSTGVIIGGLYLGLCKTQNAQFERDGIWPYCVIPPTVSRSGSVQTQMQGEGEELPEASE